MKTSFILSAALLLFSASITAYGSGGGSGNGNSHGHDKGQGHVNHGQGHGYGHGHHGHGSSSSSSSSGGDVLQTGAFIGGPVQGLSYETPTQSGLTNVNGEFSYRAGETVAFSIGGIELGSAAGAAQISPFDLFGMTPPTAELALRLELNTRKDITNFDRAANVAFLLFSLDNDADPDNGLDVTGWGSVLATTELDFNANLYKFAKKFRRFAGAHGINPDVAPTLPLSHLYKSLGIVIPVHLVSTVMVDFGNDGTDEFFNEFGYDPRGVTNSWSFSDGIFGIQDTFTYDLQGRPTAFYRAFDFEGDDIPNSVEGELSTYNSNGDLAIRTYESDFNGDGAPDYRDATSHVYDALGSLLSSRGETDADLNGATDFASDYSYTHDADGNLLTKVWYQDSDLDGNPDHIESNVYTYDAAGNILTWRLSSDTFNDGSVDLIETETSTYDAAGNRLTYLQESDFDADEVTDSYQSFTSTYDELGNELTQVVERVGGFNPGRTHTTYSYNSDRTLLMSMLRQQDFDLDGNIDYSSSTSYTYDDFGNWLAQFEEIDFDVDGVVDSANLTRHSLVTHNDGMFSLMVHYSDLTRF